MTINILYRNSTFQQTLILLSIYLNSFIQGCMLGWMSIAVYFFNEGKEISATLTEYAWMAAMPEIGKIVTSIPSGILVDKYGRKKILTTIGVINLISWIMISITKSIIVLWIARFMQGTCMGLMMTSGLAHIGEIASPKNRGKFSGAYQAASSAGILFPALLGAVFVSYRLPSYCCVVIAVLYFITLYWTKESPNYYISRGQYNKAIDVIHKIRISSTSEEILSEYETLKRYIEHEYKQKQKVSWIQFMKSKPIRQSIITATLIECFTKLTGLFAISTFMANIIPRNEYLSEKYYPSMSLVISVICNICSAFVIERLPRRTAYLIGGLVGCTIQLSNGLFYYLHEHERENLYFWAFIAGYVMLRVLWGILILPLQQTVKSEIFPQAVKGIANSICIICASISTLISYKIFHLTYQYFGLHYLFVSFGLSFLCLSAVVHWRLPESRGKRIADLQIEIRERIEGNERI